MTTRDLTDIFTHVADPAWMQAAGLFVAEGRHVTRRLLTESRFTVVALLLTPTAEAALADALDALPAERRPSIVVKSQAELDGLTRFRLHQGCVAFAERQVVPAWRPEDTIGGLSVLLERVRDPDNVGSIARSAAALGVKALLIGPECADPFYRKAVRTSMGAVLTSTIVSATPWPDVLNQLKATGHTLVATTPDPAAPDIADCGPAFAKATAGKLRTADGGLRTGDRGLRTVDRGLRTVDRGLILLVGSEGEGLTPDARRAADVEARIPMTSAVDSLNVGVATAVAVYALSRRVG